MSDTDEIIDVDDDKVDFYKPSPGDSLDDMLERRISLGDNVHNTNMSTQVEWLRQWTPFMCIREFLQNFVDYVRFRTHKDVVMHEIVPTGVWPEAWTRVVRESRCFRVSELEDITGMRFFEAKVYEKVVGHVASGRGMFLIIQDDSTLSMDCLYQRSTKQGDIKLSGTHGCGMKESALRLLSDGCRLKMWMPRQSVSSDKPGESWNWHLCRQEIMKVKGSMLKDHKIRALFTVVTDLPTSFTFDPTKFLFFSLADKTNTIPIPVKTLQGTEGYTLLLDNPRLYNYGIFVQESELCKELGFGLDGRFKLNDRYRTSVDNIQGRLAVAIKVAVRKDPAKIMPYIMRYAEKNDTFWLCFSYWRPEDPTYYHKFKDTSDMLVFGISQWKKVKVESVILAGKEWTDGQKVFARTAGFEVYSMSSTFHSFDAKVLFPIIDKRKTGLVQSQVRDFLLDTCGLVGHRLYSWDIKGLDKSALKPFYVRGKEILITTGLIEDSKLEKMLFEHLVGGHAPGLLDKAYQALKTRRPSDPLPNAPGLLDKAYQALKTRRPSDPLPIAISPPTPRVDGGKGQGKDCDNAGQGNGKRKGTDLQQLERSVRSPLPRLSEPRSQDAAATPAPTNGAGALDCPRLKKKQSFVECSSSDDDTTSTQPSVFAFPSTPAAGTPSAGCDKRARRDVENSSIKRSYGQDLIGTMEDALRKLSRIVP